VAKKKTAIDETIVDDVPLTAEELFKQISEINNQIGVRRKSETSREMATLIEQRNELRDRWMIALQNG